MHDGPQRLGRDREWQHALGVVVHDRHDVGTGRIDRGVNHPLAVRRAAARIDGRAVERELHEVIELDQRGASRARQHESLGLARIAHADVTERVDDALVSENSVRGHEPPELRQRR